MEAIILVGGKGTRLKSTVNDVPKPLAPINGKPFLTYLMDNLIEQNIKHFILSTGYKQNMIHKYFGDSYKGIKISYANEESPLGTGGAILNALKLCKSEFVYALNGDIYTNYSLNQLVNNNNNNNITLSLIDYTKKDIKRFGRVEIDNDYNIIKFLEKGKKSNSKYISAGIYLINRIWFEKEFNHLKKFSIEYDVFENSQGYKINGVPQKTLFIDIGIPESYKKFIELKK